MQLFFDDGVSSGFITFPTTGTNPYTIPYNFGITGTTTIACAVDNVPTTCSSDYNVLFALGAEKYQSLTYDPFDAPTFGIMGQQSTGVALDIGAAT